MNIMHKRTPRLAVSLLAVVTSLLPISSHPAARTLYKSAMICAQRPDVFYINGIWNDDADQDGGVVVSATTISRRMDSAGISHGPVLPLFNQSEGKLLDIFRKLLLQKAQETTAMADLVGYGENLVLAAQGQQSALSASDRSAAFDALAAGVASSMQSLVSDPATSATLNTDIRAVAGSLLTGNKAVLVAHSEGNMLAQQIYKALSNASATAFNPAAINVAPALQVVNVATPAATPDTGKYMTSSSDIVIDKLASLLSWITFQHSPAPANVAPGFSSLDPTGHKFLETYMSQTLAVASAPGSQRMGDRIVTLIANAASDAVATNTAAAGAEYPVDISASSLNNDVTYTVTENGHASDITIPATGGSLPLLQLGCDRIAPGTYEIVATTTPKAFNSSPTQYIFNFELFLGQFGAQTGMGPFAVVSQITPSAASVTLPVADVTVTPDTVSGGYDIGLYKYVY